MDHVLQAEIELASVTDDVAIRAEGDKDAPPAPGSPTPEQLRAINGKHTRVKMTADELFVFDALVTTGALDSYFTWFDATSITAFAKRVNARGVPLFRHHRWMGGFTDSMEFPIGHFFAARIDEVDAAKPPTRRIPMARDVLGIAPVKSLNLTETAYVDRAGQMDGSSSEDLIRAINAGIQRQVSIGASVHPIESPDGDLISDIDGKSLLRWDEAGSRFFPGVTYEIDNGTGDGKTSTVIATARYIGANQIEASLVGLGAHPGAEIARSRGGIHGGLIRTAQSLSQRGQLSDLDAQWIEDTYHANVLPARSYSVAPVGVAPVGVAPVGVAAPGSPTSGPVVTTLEATATEPAAAAPADLIPDAVTSAEVTMPDSTQAREEPASPAPTPVASNTSGAINMEPTTTPDPVAPPVDETAAVRAFLGDELADRAVAHRATGRTMWEAATRSLYADLAAAQAAADARALDHTAALAVITERLGVAEGQDLASALDAIQIERDGYREARDLALDGMAAAYVSAHAVVETGFDKPKFVARSRGWTLAEIQEETATLRTLARSRLTAGPSVPLVVDPRDTPPEPGPTGRPDNPAFYRS